MTDTGDPWLIDAMWRAVDLTRAYAAGDRSRVATCVTGLDTPRLERVLSWLALEHDEHFDALGEPSMGVREIDTTAALAPPEIEFATTTALRRVAAGETGLARAVVDLAPHERVHAIATFLTVTLVEAYGRPAALERLDEKTAEYERAGYPRP